MSQGIGGMRVCARCARSLTRSPSSSTVSRSFTSSTTRHADVQQQPSVDNARSAGRSRRRAAIESTSNIPFTQLPYQCFQEALSFLREDRAEKAARIEDQRKRISRLEEKLNEAGNAREKQMVLKSLYGSRKHLEWLKVQADINDPEVKRRFEDGLADMGKPVYRHLARQKWEAYERKIVMQRVTQMHVIPDVLPKVEPSTQVQLSFGRKSVAHGVVVPSTMSEQAPTVQIQTFESGERTVSIAVVDSDVPNTETDDFDFRLHALLTNVKISPAQGKIKLGGSTEDSTMVFPWLPPTSQKGAPWHRLSVWILEHPDNQTIDPESIKQKYTRDTFTMRSFEGKYLVRPIGVTMFRTKWDEGTRGVMERHGIEGADIEYKKKPITPMVYKKKDGARYR